MAEYWARFFFFFFFASLWDLNSASIHKHAEKALGQYPAILPLHLFNKPYIVYICILGKGLELACK